MVSNISSGSSVNNSQMAKFAGFTPHSKVLEKWVNKTDRFEHNPNVKTFEEKEVERLFPNGELQKIYQTIAADYGLDYLPELKLTTVKDSNDRGFYSSIHNDITIVLDFLKPEARKLLLEKDGISAYSAGDSNNLFFRIKDEDVKKEINESQKYGFKAKAEPLSDDDKRKIMIFLLAHELSHVHQSQLIRHTEGLDEWNIFEERINKFAPKNMNLIDKKLTMIQMKRNYETAHSMVNKEKIYSQNSPEGRQAVEWYNANINYSIPDMSYEENINNPLEIDANKRATEYLIKHYGYFKNTMLPN